MSTIIEKLNEILAIKNNIKYAIRDKGIDIPDYTPFAEYPNYIRNISTGNSGGGDGGDGGDGKVIIKFKAASEINANFAVMRVNNQEYMGNQLSYNDGIYSLNVGAPITQLRFYRNSNISEIIELDVSNMTNMNEMFYECTSLKYVDANNWVTSAVRDGGVFKQCTGLEIVDISNWDTSGMKNCSAFYNCTSLHTIRMDNCSNATINMITGTGDFPSGTIEGVTRTIYCKEANVAGLTAPEGWVFSYVN